LIGKIGMMEVLIILAVALIIFGPTKLPELGRSIGKGISELRNAGKDLQKSIDIDEEIEKDKE